MRLPERYDPLVVSGQTLSVAALVEEEILLALPAIPRHEGEACTAAKASDLQQRQENDVSEASAANPFAVLAQLKSKH